MPDAPKRHCTYPGCATLVLQGRCGKHQYQHKGKRQSKRPSSSAQGYGREWQKKRARQLREHPYCQIRVKCRGIAAKHVDHKVSKAQGGTDDPSNLQSACRRCHSWKTAKYDRQRNDRGEFA